MLPTLQELAQVSTEQDTTSPMATGSVPSPVPGPSRYPRAAMRQEERARELFDREQRFSSRRPVLYHTEEDDDTDQDSWDACSLDEDDWTTDSDDSRDEEEALQEHIEMVKKYRQAFGG